MPSRQALVYSGVIVGFVILLIINSTFRQNSELNHQPEKIGNWQRLSARGADVDLGIAQAQFTEPVRIASLPASSIGNAAMLFGAVESPNLTDASIAVQGTLGDSTLNWPVLVRGIRLPNRESITLPKVTKTNLRVNGISEEFICAIRTDDSAPPHYVGTTDLVPDVNDAKIFIKDATAPLLIDLNLKGPASIELFAVNVEQVSPDAETSATDDAAPSGDAATPDEPAGAANEPTKKVTPANGYFFSIRLSPQSDLDSPKIVAIKNNWKGNETRFENVTTPVSTYGGFLYVKGQLKAKSRLDFEFFKKSSDKAFEFVGKLQPDNVSRDTENFTADLVLPDQLIGGLVLPAAFTGDRRAYAERPIPVHNERLRAETAQTVPSISTTHGGDPVNGVRISNRFKLQVSGKVPGIIESDSARVWVRYRDLNSGNVLEFAEKTHKGVFEFDDAKREWTSPQVDADSLSLVKSGEYEVFAQIVQGNQISGESTPLRFRLQDGNVTIQDVHPKSGLLAPGRINVTLFFDKSHPLKSGVASEKKFYSIKPTDITSDKAEVPMNAEFDPNTNSVALTFRDITAGNEFKVNVLKEVSGTKFEDIFGNPLGDETSTGVLQRSVTSTTPIVSAGVSDHTGEYVKYTEFTKPRKNPDGFNPADKVEARVVRLYYYRDAHRVAQIINRKVKSYNKKAVSVQRQLAEKARSDADQKTLQRQDTERLAVQAAEKTRRKENELEAKEQQLQRMFDELRAANTEGQEQAVSRLQRTAEYLSNRIDDLRSAVEKLRDDEIKLNNQLQKLEGEEQIARKEQFRREVAAAHEDPDTYAEGVPDSDDPVEQVSVSVIGEGLIHLRGPMKGINTIRLMINEIDSPIGQVRIGIHTVQINGEDGEKMEIVADRIQKHIDHARFMTTQTSEMLRKAIVQVASRVAHQTAMEFPGVTQADRDLRYLYCFFGRDFVNVLRSMDSELLRTGNKLLSLHSMDSTSLASALTVMSLAKNDIRGEILSCFEEMLMTKLPQAEHFFFEQSLATCRDKHHRHCNCPEFPLLSQNAKFESIKGFFNAEVMGTDTISPLQREVIKLAQIFKARLITEMQYNQRVRERAVIEERLQDSEEQARLQKAREKSAQKNFESVTQAIEPLIQEVLTAILQLSAEINAAVESRITNSTQQTQLLLPSGVNFSSTTGDTTVNLIANAKQSIVESAAPNGKRGDPGPPSNQDGSKDDATQSTTTFTLANIKETEAANSIAVNYDPATRSLVPMNDGETLLIRLVVDEFNLQKDLFNSLTSDFNFWPFVKPKIEGLSKKIKDVDKDIRKLESHLRQAIIDAKQKSDTNAKIDAEKLSVRLEVFVHLDEIDKGNRELVKRIKEAVAYYREEVDRIILNIGSAEGSFKASYESWVKLRGRVGNDLKSIGLTTQWSKAVLRVDERFRQLLLLGIKQDFAKSNLERAQRPLDHKKFLDMLIDDLEEKHIEQLNGTRAQIANIDNYIKRVATALEDDFNNQFYLPAFRCVRQASRYRDVNLGQTETTTILANNRAFAKVSPQATMEFDLPARDILITEAMNGAKAMIDEYGALVTDGSFLAMSKLGAGQSPMTAAAGSTGGFATERTALSGLSGSTQENILNQNGPGRSQFGSAFENLIPDPAIYKFETGTGFEIRPVVQPDGQAVVFDFNYMYTTNVREPVRADEKHLGRVKRHFINTDVQLSNYELRRVSKYMVALKASRTARGVPLLEDIPGVGALFRPLPQQESSLQQNVILAQATIFPTLFDLMGLRWAPAIADVDPLRLSNDEFLVRGRHRALENRVYDFSSSKVDEFLRIPEANRRSDLYRTQETIPDTHPNGYHGSGLDYEEGNLRERNVPFEPAVPSFIPQQNPDGAIRKQLYYQNSDLIDSKLDATYHEGYHSTLHESSPAYGQSSLGIQGPQQPTARPVRRSRTTSSTTPRASSRKTTRRSRSYRGTVSR